MNPDHLRAAIEKIGIEKPSDYTLVLEEVGRMEAEEKLVERVARSIALNDLYTRSPSSSDEDLDRVVEGHWDEYTPEAMAALDASGLLPLLTASEAFIREAEEMGWGKTSDKALPGSFDSLVAATRSVRG